MTVRYVNFHFLLTEETVAELLATRCVFTLGGEPLETLVQVREAKAKDGVVESRERK